MRALGNGPELPGMAGRHCRPSDLVLRIPGQLVDTSGPQERARVPRYSWSNPRASGPGPKTPWTTGRTQGPADPSSRHPGKLFDTAGPRAQSQVTRNSWSTPRASDPGLSRPGELVVHGTHPESPGGAGRTRGHSFSSVSCPGFWSTPRASNPGPSCRGHLVNPVGDRALAQVAQDRRCTSRALGHEPVSSGLLVDPGALRPKHETPGKAV